MKRLNDAISLLKLFGDISRYLACMKLSATRVRSPQFPSLSLPCFRPTGGSKGKAQEADPVAAKLMATNPVSATWQIRQRQLPSSPLFHSKPSANLMG